MYLRQLSGSGSPGFVEWREMWNDEVLPYLLSLRPVGGPGTRIDRTDGGTVIRAVPTAAGIVPPPADAGYSSYFKLTMADTSSGAVVTVADGATGSDSIAVVNGGSTYSLPPYSETVSGARVFLSHVHPGAVRLGRAGRFRRDDGHLFRRWRDTALRRHFGRVLYAARARDKFRGLAPRRTGSHGGRRLLRVLYDLLGVMSWTT